MSRFKTELCNNLIELGSCKYGDRCHYAHGAHELRQVSRRHPKYRTESCKNFELTGKCPFGPRCSYVHPKPDLDSLIEQLSKYMKHTKAPKPDSEDGEDIHMISIKQQKQRTTKDPTISSLCDENKENQLVVNYQVFKDSTNHLIERPQIHSNHETSTSILKNTFSPPSPSSNNANTAASVPFSANINNGTCSNNILSPESPSYDSVKKLRLISNINPSSNTASNPFGIRNPLSDYFNNTNINGRNSLHPNKQFYTRF